MEEKKPNIILKRERELRGWSQQTVAERVQTTEQVVCRWESGRHKPNRYFQTQLCQLFGKSAEELGFMDKVVFSKGEREKGTPVLGRRGRPLDLRISPTDEQNSTFSTEDTREAVGELEEALSVNLSDPINRRTLFAQLLGISPTLFALDGYSISSFANAVSVLAEASSPSIDEKTLITFENVTENCWLLLRYDGLLTVEQLLPIYLQSFAFFAQKPSRYQERVASIVAQGYMLQGLVSVLNSDSAGGEKCCKQAVFFARLAKDRNLEAAALKHLATKFLDNGHPLWTLQTFQEVLPFVKDISPLLRGRTYLGLALAYARIHQKNDALYYLDLAHDSFPKNPESDESFSFADCHTSSLHHYGGLIHIEFAQFERAHDMFVQVEELPTRSTIPERTRIEIMNCQAETSLALRDVRSSCDLIEKSITGALKLKSDKRYHDALALYKQARLLWPQDRHMKDLADLFTR
jgi:transcriptional regulator with XRE-family HTH domain